jgi:hypothetical protein
MRGTDVGYQPSRIKGRASLTRRLSALLLAVHRFGTHRARGRDEVLWAGRVLEQLWRAAEEAGRS